MPTLTHLEDCVHDTPECTEEYLTVLTQAKQRLLQAMNNPLPQTQYQQFTLLLEAVIQAEDIIRVIYFRYHNHPVNSDEK